MKSHILAIDLESWIFSKKINSQEFSIDQLRKLEDKYTYRVLDYLLKILKKNNQRITFFVVTKLEEMYPGICEIIKEAGHEIGWHTHTHARIDSEEILLQELRLGEKYIKKYKIKGFQSPEIYFFREGYKILKEFGFIYSSSIYGDTQKIYKFDGVYEVPVSVSNENYKPAGREILFPNNFTLTKMLRYGLPYGSSFFWGILGKKYYSEKLTRMEKENKICNLFIHEWQLVPPTSKEYKKDVNFFWNPLFLPYKIDVSSLFEYLISTFKFMPMIKLFS